MGNWRGVPDSTVRAFLHQRHQPWTKDAPIPKEQAMLEACLILVLNTHGFGERDLAERWGRSRNFVRAILKAAAEEMTSSEVPGWKVPKRTTEPTGHGTGGSDTEQWLTTSKGTKKVPEEYQEGTKKADHARSICREDESRGDQTASSFGEESGEARNKDNEAGAAQNLQAAVGNGGGVERAPREMPPQGTSQIFPGVGRPKLSRGRGGANLSEFGARKPGQPSGSVEKPPPHVVMREGGYPVKEEDGWYEVYFIGGKECRRYCREDGL